MRTCVCDGEYVCLYSCVCVCLTECVFVFCAYSRILWK